MFHPGQLTLGVEANYAVCCDMGICSPFSLPSHSRSRTLLDSYSHQAVMNLLSGIVADNTRLQRPCKGLPRDLARGRDSPEGGFR